MCRAGRGEKTGSWGPGGLEPPPSLPARFVLFAPQAHPLLLVFSRGAPQPPLLRAEAWAELCADTHSLSLAGEGPCSLPQLRPPASASEHWHGDKVNMP